MHNTNITALSDYEEDGSKTVKRLRKGWFNRPRSLVVRKNRLCLQCHGARTETVSLIICLDVVTIFSCVFFYRYDQHLSKAQKTGIQKGAIAGICLGFIRFIIFCTYAVGFYYGTQLVYEENLKIGDIFVVSHRHL